MRKWIMMLAGTCLLVLASGCSQTSQAAGEKQQVSDHQQTNQINNQSKQPSKKQNKKKPGPIASLNWQAFQNKHDAQIKPKKQTKPDSQSTKGIIPVQIKIPAINVDTEVIKKGIVKQGEYKGHMATPDNAVQTAWFKLGPKPGQKGSAIIAGHVDTYKGPGVFFNLEDLKQGDLVYITGKNGKTLTFKVYKKQAYPRKSAPVYKVFGYTPARVVRLLTCTGTFDEAADTHNERLVVSAKLVQKDQKS
ncbi:MAG TPA: class F sortase [Bacillales bacterium]|nr:class F sortase [Bacillales bacterium]